MREQPVLNAVLQVAIVVADAEAVAKRFADDYGVGPWGFYVLDETNSRNTIVHGRRVEGRAKFAVAYLGSMQFELCEPLDDDSIYAEHLAEHGPSLHHLAFGTPDPDAALATFAQNGHGEIASGGFMNFAYHYLDTQADLGVCVELYKGAGDPQAEFYPPVSTYPPGIDFEAVVRQATSVQR